MSFFNEYPYININDLNLDFILKAIREMRYEVTNFVSINAIKYADPIQWNITSQYEKNTIVIDPVTGTAYISVAAVPAGVALTREEYWTVVFDLGSFVTRAAQNFTSRWESETTLTATFSTPAGAWLVWGDVLYKALTNITAGDTYVVNGNIAHITMEEIINAIMQAIDDEVQARQDAIANEVQARTDADDALSDRIDDEVQARQNADNAMLAKFNNMKIVNVLDFGAKGDGATDDTQAFLDFYAYVIENSCCGYIPNGTYLMSYRGGAGYRTPNNNKWAIIGESKENTIIKADLYDDNTQANVMDFRYCNNFEISNLTLRGAGSSNQRSGSCLYLVNCNNASVHDITIDNCSYNAVLVFSDNPTTILLSNLHLYNFDCYGVQNNQWFDPDNPTRKLFPSGFILENINDSVIENIKLHNFKWYGIELKDECKHDTINNCDFYDCVTACHIGGERQDLQYYANECIFDNIHCYNTDVPIVGGHFARCIFNVNAIYDYNYTWKTESVAQEQYSARCEHADFNTFNLNFVNIPYGGIYFNDSSRNAINFLYASKGATFATRAVNFVNGVKNIVNVLNQYGDLDFTSYLYDDTVINDHTNTNFLRNTDAVGLERMRLNWNSVAAYTNYNLNLASDSLSIGAYSEDHVITKLYGSAFSANKGYIRLLINHPDDTEPSITLRFHNGATNTNTDYQLTKANLDALFALI